MYWSDLNLNKFNQLNETVRTVVLPIGTTEAHGLHCPLGTDFMIPNAFAKIIEEHLGDQLLIAPTVNYGCSWNLGVFPGTVNISSETMALYIEEICQGFLNWGIDQIVFFNGHGGNRPALQIAAQHIADQGGKVLIINWWVDYMPQILTICEGRGHAGEDETSAVLAIAPELVEMQVAQKNNNKPIGQIYTSDISFKLFEHALTGDATLASVEKGKAIYQVVGKEVIELIQNFMLGKYID